MDVHRYAVKRTRFATLLLLGACGFVNNAVGNDMRQTVLQGEPVKAVDDAKADLVIVNGLVWTGAGREGVAAPNEPTAIAVVGDRIRAVGTDAAIRALAGPRSRVIDAKGRRVIPGITDSHTHIISGGLNLGRLNLRQTKNREEFVRAVEAAAKSVQPGGWMLGGRWSVESWTDSKPPNRSWIDPVTGKVPVLLERMDGHQALANSAALKLAGIDAAGPKDPPGGEIERDPATGEPTGILKESAAELVSAIVPSAQFDERYQALRKAMEHANSFGITSIHDMSEPDDLPALSQAHDVHALTIRVTTYLSVSDWPINLDRVRGFPIHDDMFRVAGLKGYMDGSLGSRTAYMREPYQDAAQSKYPKGQLTAVAASQESFSLMVANAQNHGIQLAVHAIGDQANHLLLNAYELANKYGTKTDVRNRIEHAQHLLLDDIPRFAKIGVVASMQPYHKADDGRYAERALGAERLKGSYAFRQLVDAGALLCFGSDFPVVTLDPFVGMDAAVNAKTLSGEVWLPGHSLSVEEALRSYTVNPPKAVHRDDRLGTLEVEKLADVVILTEDVLKMPKERISEVKAWQTIVGGKVVYSREK